MGRHVIVGLLRSSRPEGWAFIESLLLAAQRQEGLRQAIFEAADEAHPDAFTRLVGLAVNENLIRFASTIRAVSVWFGFPEDAAHIDDAERRLRLLQDFRADQPLAARRVVEGDAWDTYAGLCAIAQHDIWPAVDLAREALARPGRDNRAAALRFLANTQLSSELLLPIFVTATADPDLGVASMAHQAMAWHDPEATTLDVYGAFDALARRLPETAGSADPVGIDPDPVPLDRGAVVASMIRIIGDRPLEPMLAYLPSMDPHTRGALARKAGERKRLDGDLRNAGREDGRRPIELCPQARRRGHGGTPGRRRRGARARTAPHPQGRRSAARRDRAAGPPARSGRARVSATPVGRVRAPARRRM